MYLAGRALASVLGLNLSQAVASLQDSQAPAATYRARVGLDDVPYQRISGFDKFSGWNERARALITQVVTDAGADQSRQGALFIATSCQDGDVAESAESAGCDVDFHALSGRIGEWLGWTGPVFLISSACTSSMQALLSAAEWLGAGNASQALVLGVELDNHLTLSGFAAMQLLSPSRSKPFALERDGLVLGEAVAALYLSTEQIAPWQLLGGANVVDGIQPNSACAAAVTQMYERAIAASGRTAADVDLIKVQATGSRDNDASEAQGLRAAFADMPSLVSLKPLIGHCMGASGAAEIALLLECLEQDCWPRYPDAVDPALGVQLAIRPPMQTHCLLATILGFGGSHTAVVLGRS